MYVHRALYLFQTVLFSLSFLRVSRKTNLRLAQLFLIPKAIRSQRASTSERILSCLDNQRLFLMWIFPMLAEYKTYIHICTQFLKRFLIDQ